MIRYRTEIPVVIFCNDLIKLFRNQLCIITTAAVDKVDIELSKMNEAQREVSMTFARRIENADPELLEKLRKALTDD